MIHRRKTVTGITVLLAGAIAVGCNTASSPNTSDPIPAGQPYNTIHTNKEGIPVSPFSRGGVQALIVAYVSWGKPTASFGYTGEMIFGKNHNDWMPLSLIEDSMRGAGIPNTIQNGTLNFEVPSEIGANTTHLPRKLTIPSHSVGVAINDKLIASLPYLKPSKKSATYVPIKQLIKDLAPIHIKLQWKLETGQYAAEWDIGSPVYGLVTTVTSGDSGHFSRTESDMTIIHKGNNWIPYDYIGNSLDNAQAGITVNTIGNFAGLNITVPASVPVNMEHLPNYPSAPKNEVPIEINNHVVGYAHSMVPKTGRSTGYLSSAEVMSVIQRIGLSMHWNHTNGTFTLWNITEPSLQKPNG